MRMEEALVQKYGPLLSVAQLAQILDRSTEGLRVSLRGGGSPWIDHINSARLKIGRRVYFRTAEIAKFLAER